MKYEQGLTGVVEPEKGFDIRITAKFKNARLVGAKEMLDLSSIELCQQIGIGYQGYLNYENLRCYPSRETQEKICRFFRRRGIYLNEAEVFPEQLRGINPRREYVSEGTIPTEKLLSLSHLSADDRKMLPIVESDVENLAEYSLLKDKVNSVLETLTHREREIIRLRFGLNPENRQYTYDEIGKIFSVVRERVRGIEAKAIRKLQHPVRSKKLEVFLETIMGIKSFQ